MADFSFDIVSEINQMELDNAFNQADREIGTRFDFKNTGTKFEKGDFEVSKTQNKKDYELLARYARTVGVKIQGGKFGRNSGPNKINEIKEKLAQTEKIKTEAKRLLEETQKEMENFEEYKKQIIDKAKISTDKLIEKRTKEMEIALTRKSADAVKLIENEKSKIKQQLKEEFTDTVINLVRNYLVASKNNAVSDEEIINRFIKQKN